MSHNTLLHRALRPAVSVLAVGGVSPNLLTSLRLLTGLGAAACFAAGPGPDAVGGAVFLLSMLLDRADGALARRRGCFSRFGALFDITSDCVSTMATFAGLGLGTQAAVPFMAGAGPAAGPLLGAVGAIGVGAVFVQLRPSRGSAGSGARLFDPDDIMLGLPVVVCCGGAGWLVLLAALFAPAAAVVVAILNLQGRRTNPEG